MEYKDRSINSYIYKLTLLIDTKEFVKGSIYIGQHKVGDNTYFSSGLIPRRIVKRHGVKAFRREIITQGNYNSKLINELERHYIRLYNSYRYTNYKTGLNLTEGGEVPPYKGKEIHQYSLEGAFIRSWPSATLAANTLGMDATPIIKNARGESYSRAGNFQWSYDRELAGIKEYRSPNWRMVFRFNNSKRIIAVYKNLQEAEKDIGVIGCAYNIRKKVNSGRYYKGSLWSYTDKCPDPANADVKIIHPKRWSGVLEQFDLDGNKVAEWKTANEAASALGLNSYRLAKAYKREEVYESYFWKKQKSRKKYEQ